MTMTYDEFSRSLSQETPPDEISSVLKALWVEAKGDWAKAHEIVQDLNTDEAAWVHAYLHRKEGDRGNAAYWYRRAGNVTSGMSHEEEWAHIAQQLIDGR